MKYILRRSLCMLMLLATLLGITACATNKDPLKAPMEAKNMQKLIEIQTQYGPIQFPETLAANMRHEETTQGNVAVEVFYMITQSGEMESFRIYYGDSNMGTHMGYLETDAGEISVSYAICEYADEDFASEEDRILFHNMMTAFTVVTNSIQADARYSELRAMEQVEERTAGLRYWSITLPDNIEWVETEADGVYRVDFYGMVAAERIDLYYVGLGEMEAESLLGYFTVDGQQKPVMLGISFQDAYDNWSAEEQRIIYDMMDSVNIVIQQIVSSKNFSEFAE